MKQTITLFSLLFIVTISQAQIGIGTNNPNASAKLDISSTSKGLLPPRMTTADRDAITTPATGLQIYNTDNKALETYNNGTIGWFTVGSGKGAGYDNTTLGVSTLNANVAGYANTAIGYAALYANTDGIQNTSTGNQSLSSNTTGSDNTANGNQSLNSNTSGSNNTAVGFKTLFSNTSGYFNAAYGASAFITNTSGYYNTAIGPVALFNNTTGYYNSAFGYSALSANTSGYNNSAFGAQADVSAGALINTTVIGSGAIVTASNKVRIGNSSVTVIEGQVAFTSVSDARIKDNIKESVPGLAFIAELRPVTYTLNSQKQEAITMQAMPDSIKAKHRLLNGKNTSVNTVVRTGFIAQEVAAAAKKIGYDFDGVSIPQNETDLYGISYAEFVVPLVKAVQEQQVIIEKLLKRIEILEKN
jgi:hypothetical protein